MAAKWTVDDIPDLQRQVAVVTGANSGFGFEIALQLAAHRAHVVLTGLDQGRIETATAKIAERVPAASLETIALDLASLASVRRFAAMCEDRHQGLDILVNNGGVALLPKSYTSDGFERVFGVNHLGHFALTGVLLAMLLRRATPRVVTMSALAAAGGKIDLEDLQGQRRYSPIRAYTQSKLANLHFAFELDRRARAAGSGLVSVAAHPGVAPTKLGMARPGDPIRLSGRILGVVRTLAGVFESFSRNAREGAVPPLYAATAAGVAGGSYIGPDGLFGAFGRHPVATNAPKQAMDADVARRLWEVSERMTGVGYDALCPPDP